MINTKIKQKGVTTIELSTIIAIIIVMLIAGIVRYQEGKEGSLYKENIKQIFSILEQLQHLQENHSYEKNTLFVVGDENIINFQNKELLNLPICQEKNKPCVKWKPLGKNLETSIAIMDNNNRRNIYLYSRLRDNSIFNSSDEENNLFISFKKMLYTLDTKNTKSNIQNNGKLEYYSAELNDFKTPSNPQSYVNRDLNKIIVFKYNFPLLSKEIGHDIK